MAQRSCSLALCVLAGVLAGVLGMAAAMQGQAHAQSIVLASDSRGHFISQGRINGQATQFMADTGATLLAIGVAEADRMQLDYKNTQPVRIGDVELTGLDAVSVPASMPYILLGNNFLAQFQMTRTSDQMVLERRY